MNRVGLVIPAYREGENIAHLIRAIFSTLPMSEVVVVDDSPDEGTRKAVESVKAPDGGRHTQLHYVHRSEKGGRGSAVIEGLRLLLQRDCEILIEMDADFSHPPEQLPELLKLRAQHGADLVIASRYLPRSRILNWPLSRRIFSKCANLLARAVLRIPISDYTNGYRCYSRQAGELISEKCGRLGKGFISLSEILVTLHSYGHKLLETPTVFTNRVRGESSLNLTELKNAALGIFQIKMLQNELKSQQRDGLLTSKFMKKENV
jgi:dolichol-phosphate mannosyltransferase